MGSSSGLIIAFVVAVWAAYFVPLALRRYDEAGRTATVDSAGDEGRVIKAATSARTDAVDADATDAVSPASQGEHVQAIPSPAEIARVAMDRPAARLAARRRRRTLLSLLMVLTVVTGVAVAGVIPVWSIAAPVLLVVAWLVACRVQVRGERGLSTSKARMVSLPKPSISAPSLAKLKRERPAKAPRERVAKRQPVAATSAAVAPRSVDDEDTVVISGQDEDVDPGRRHEMEMTPPEVDALDDQIVIAVPSVSTAGQALWDPLPITVPTYVTKPRVGRTVRTIDFSQPTLWSSGHVEGEGEQLPGTSAESAEAEAETPRAVGE